MQCTMEKDVEKLKLIVAGGKTVLLSPKEKKKKKSQKQFDVCELPAVVDEVVRPKWKLQYHIIKILHYK